MLTAGFLFLFHGAVHVAAMCSTDFSTCLSLLLLHCCCTAAAPPTWTHTVTALKKEEQFRKIHDRNESKHTYVCKYSIIESSYLYSMTPQELSEQSLCLKEEEEKTTTTTTTHKQTRSRYSKQKKIM